MRPPVDRFAYFTLNEDDLNARLMPRDKLIAWLRQFTLVVCKATVDISWLQEALPGVRFLAYLGGRHIPSWLEEPFSGWDWPKAHAARFPEEYLLRDLAETFTADGPYKGKPKGFTTYDFKYENGVWVRKRNPSGMVQITVNDATAEAYQSLLREVVMPRGFRHVYIDSYEQFDVRDYALYRRPIDADGDGKGDEAIIQEDWNDGSCDLIGQALREVLGPAATIIGNTGRRRVDPALSGITLEEYPQLHIRFPEFFQSEYAVSVKPAFNVYWVKTGNGLAWFDTQRAAGKMPMVLHGQMGDANSPEVRPGLRNPRYVPALT